MTKYENITSPKVAKAQRYWERGTAIVRARDAGATLREVGKGIGLSRERTRQIEYKTRRLMGRPSPIEKDIGIGATELRYIAAKATLARNIRLANKIHLSRDQGWRKPKIGIFAEFD